VEPTGEGISGGNRKANEDKKQSETLRAKTDEYAHSLYYRPSDFTIVDRVKEIAQSRG